MTMNRRELLCAGASAAAFLSAGPESISAQPHSQRLGVVIHSYMYRQAADAQTKVPFDDPLTFLDYCRASGAGGAQIPLGIRDEAYAARLRQQLEANDLYIEGSSRLPAQPEDTERFASEISTARACGARVVRTVLMTGRRYEVFNNLNDFRRFKEQARKSLTLAKPIVERQQIRLAVENHKDLLTAELIDLIKEIDSPFVGVCVDTGNNVALLESPDDVVAALAPLAFTVHFKDMGVQEYADGFLLAEVPLGTGFLDLAKIVQVLRTARPNIHLNLEMITRDPLRVPCLTDKYWATLESIPARQLARMLAMTRARAAASLPRLSDLKRDEQLQREDDNVRACLRYAREKLK